MTFEQEVAEALADGYCGSPFPCIAGIFDNGSMIWVLVGLVTLLGLVALRDALQDERKRREDSALRDWHARRLKARAEQRAKEQAAKQTPPSDGRNW